MKYLYSASYYGPNFQRFKQRYEAKYGMDPVSYGRYGCEDAHAD